MNNFQIDHSYRTDQGAPAKVLVVQSNPAVAEMTVLVLAAAGHLAVQTASGEQALRTQSRLVPDIILLDRALKDMAAAELCRVLRSRTAAPILVLTTDHDPDVHESLLAEGASECLPLPIHTGELLGRISGHLRAQRQPAANAEAKRETTPDPTPRAAA
ncbi:response regulator transcription factor [Nocardia sp. CDC160]|uniref:response regulator transcription factor n=1 Tax=Nocardia sp. CDC160 TaxID=3112166 RepID=UPI002DBF7660|nr:response regulator [Nocardia sp. CDC160]MEC3918825.1 response regulator [Nocardia sp. CDC160]